MAALGLLYRRTVFLLDVPELSMKRSVTITQQLHGQCKLDASAL